KTLGPEAASGKNREGKSKGYLLSAKARQPLLFHLLATECILLLGNWLFPHSSEKRKSPYIVVTDPCNPSTLGGQGGRITRSGVRDQPGHLSETPSLLKIQKLAGHGGVCLKSQLLGRLRQENCFNLGGGGCGEPRLCHYTPAWATERDSDSKKQKEREEKEKKKEKAPT
uniref:Uncharacterized protein n=1 Tax=Pongo abelii TaxID=9601 RepID=A0A8I5TIE5_PONAB